MEEIKIKSIEDQVRDIFKEKNEKKVILNSGWAVSLDNHLVAFIPKIKNLGFFLKQEKLRLQNDPNGLELLQKYTIQGYKYHEDEVCKKEGKARKYNDEKFLQMI